jgi:hypothetical protein
MPQEDNEAAELAYAEEIALVIFPAADESAEIVEPCKEALDFPAPTVATKFAAVLGALTTAVVLVWRDEPDAVFLSETPVERIAVVGAVADHSLWFGSRETLRDGQYLRDRSPDSAAYIRLQHAHGIFVRSALEFRLTIRADRALSSDIG